jgi:type I restriction enzyme S subunit
VSNIDKHTVEGEVPVRLCNYVDVYKNERITENTNFMKATANWSEAARFQLRVGDVLITKDSETWNDIGIPALVSYEAPDLVSGYHLALIRPHEGLLLGEYLHRVLQVPEIAAQLHVRANGVTRFGLPHAAIKSIEIPIPPTPMQRQIALFLDHADRRINRLIRAKRRVIELLNEQKQAIINRAVTRGLDPDVRLKPSGIDWLGDVPEHWPVIRLKSVFREVDERSTTGDETLLSLRMYAGLVPHSEVSTRPFEAATLVGYKRIQPGDVVMNRMRAAIGLFGVAHRVGLVSPDYAILRPRMPINPSYFLGLFKTRALQAVFRVESKGLGTGSSGFLRLYMEQFGRIPVPVPSKAEQDSIQAYVDESTHDLTVAQSRISAELSLLAEYRTRLIADVVTGKVDVRGVELPPLDGDEAPDGERVDDAEAVDDAEDLLDEKSIDEELGDGE